MTATMRIAGLIALAACATASAPTPVANQDGSAERAALVRRAEEALASETETADLRRTSLSPPIDRRETAERFLAACSAGDHRSCWIAFEIGGPGEAALPAIRANCEAGDQLSCRALPAMTGPTDAKELARACAAGYPASCARIITYAPAQSELTNRVVELVRQGCAAGITGECDLMLGIRIELDLPDKLLASRQLCSIAHRRCYLLGHVEWTDVIKRRDLFEHACQYGVDRDAEQACEELNIAYFFHDYPEPVPGRWMALEEWDCRRRGIPIDGCLQRLRREYGGPLAPPPIPEPAYCEGQRLAPMRPSSYCSKQRRPANSSGRVRTRLDGCFSSLRPKRFERSVPVSRDARPVSSVRASDG